eukprot:SAG22_NODE_2068_length_3054_cov_2.135025_1_plen_271_part_10
MVEFAADGLPNAGKRDGGKNDKKKKKTRAKKSKRQGGEESPAGQPADGSGPKKRHKSESSLASGCTCFGADPGVAAVAVSTGTAAGPDRVCGLGAAGLETAAGLLEDAGMVALGPAVLPTPLLQRLAAASAALSAEVQAKLRAAGIPFEAEAEGGAAAAASLALERRHSFKFHEVASRCLGRLDIRHQTDRAPFDDPLLVSNPVWLPLVKRLLGPKAVLLYTGLVVNLPGSADQAWHIDGEHLYGAPFERGLLVGPGGAAAPQTAAGGGGG